MLPEATVGELTLLKLDKEQKFTKPPSDIQSPFGKVMEEKGMVVLMYATIIQTLYDRYYVERDGSKAFQRAWSHC